MAGLRFIVHGKHFETEVLKTTRSHSSEKTLGQFSERNEPFFRD